MVPQSPPKGVQYRTLVTRRCRQPEEACCKQCGHATRSVWGSEIEVHAEVSPAGERCQLSWHYCYQGGMRDAGNFGGDGYDFEAIKRTMEYYGVSDLTLFGGEPLLASMSRLVELFAFGHERFGGSNIQTNGELITEEHIKLFKLYRVTVGTSLDGPDELNDVRWNDNLAATRAATATIEANIARLCREGIRTSVIVTLHRLNGTGANFDRLREWIKGLVEIGITSMRLHILEADTPMVRSKYLMSNEEYLAAFLDLMRFEEELGRPLFDIPTDLRRMLLGEDDDVTCIWAGCDSYATGEVGFSVTHPGGRKAAFVGDLVDRGPGVAKVLRLVMTMVADGVALCVAGNHESKLARKLQGRNTQVTHGLAESLTQLDMESPAFRQQVVKFLDGLISHYVLDGGNLVVAHAGMKTEYQGRASARVRDFCLYGETTGETDEFGLPVRTDWAASYRGRAMVVYGHTPVTEPAWFNNTMNIDTGCVFGGKLTALRYPEKELVSVPAARVYYEAARPLAEAGRPEGLSAPAETRAADLLDIDDVLGKRVISTRLRGKITVREENGAAALEVMSRFALDPAGSYTCRPQYPHATPPGFPTPLNIRRRYLPTSAITAYPVWSAKKSTWAHGPSSWRGGTPQPSSGALASPAKGLVHATRAQDEGSLKTAPSRRSFWNVSAPRSQPPTFGLS